GGNDYTYVITLPSDHPNLDIRVYCCTTYTGQTNIEVRVNGVMQSINATGNTSGTFLEWNDVAPSSDLITVAATNGNLPGEFFVYMNGIMLSPVGSGDPDPALVSKMLAYGLTI